MLLQIIFLYAAYKFAFYTALVFYQECRRGVMIQNGWNIAKKEDTVLDILADIAEMLVPFLGLKKLILAFKFTYLMAHKRKKYGRLHTTVFGSDYEFTDTKGEEG